MYVCCCCCCCRKRLICAAVNAALRARNLQFRECSRHPLDCRSEHKSRRNKKPAWTSVPRTLCHSPQILVSDLMQIAGTSSPLSLLPCPVFSLTNVSDMSRCRSSSATLMAGSMHCAIPAAGKQYIAISGEKKAFKQSFADQASQPKRASSTTRSGVAVAHLVATLLQAERGNMVNAAYLGSINAGKCMNATRCCPGKVSAMVCTQGAVICAEVACITHL